MVKIKFLAAAFVSVAVGLASSAANAQAAAEIAPATPLADVPRNQTLILGWSITSPMRRPSPSPFLKATASCGSR